MGVGAAVMPVGKGAELPGTRVPISHMASEKCEVGLLKQEFPFLKYPTQVEEAPGEELELDLMDRVGVVLVQRSRGRHTSRGRQEQS